MIEFLESYSVYVQEKHKEKAAQVRFFFLSFSLPLICLFLCFFLSFLFFFKDDGVVYIPKVDKAPQMKSTMMPAISSALKRSKIVYYDPYLIFVIFIMTLSSSLFFFTEFSKKVLFLSSEDHLFSKFLKQCRNIWWK